eukprot:XP_001700186.1 predicted protein [Chlamydomonas reinhardtii]
MFNPVESEAVVNALRRWQCSFGFRSRRIHNCGSITDPYVRLILDRCLPPAVERQLCSEPLDALLNAVIALINVASGFDTRAWRLRWPAAMRMYEIDSATVHAQKAAALGDIDTACSRSALVGGVWDLGDTLRRLAAVGYDPSRPTLWLVEDVVEYMLPSAASQLFAAMSAHCAPGSRLVASLSDVKLRDLLRRYGHTTHLVEEFEPPGIVLNRICAADAAGAGAGAGQLCRRGSAALPATENGLVVVVVGVTVVAPSSYWSTTSRAGGPASPGCFSLRSSSAPKRPHSWPTHNSQSSKLPAEMRTSTSRPGPGAEEGFAGADAAAPPPPPPDPRHLDTAAEHTAVLPETAAAVAAGGAGVESVGLRRRRPQQPLEQQCERERERELCGAMSRGSLDEAVQQQQPHAALSGGSPRKAPAAFEAGAAVATEAPARQPAARTGPPRPLRPGLYSAHRHAVVLAVPLRLQLLAGLLEFVNGCWGCTTAEAEVELELLASVDMAKTAANTVQPRRKDGANSTTAAAGSAGCEPAAEAGMAELAAGDTPPHPCWLGRQAGRLQQEGTMGAVHAQASHARA